LHWATADLIGEFRDGDSAALACLTAQQQSGLELFKEQPSRPSPMNLSILLLAEKTNHGLGSVELVCHLSAFLLHKVPANVADHARL
jgi:hypothetical protein